MTLKHPFQRLCYTPALSDQGKNAILLAASGPTIASLDLSGRRLSTWPSDQHEISEDDIDEQSQTNEENGDHPSKRRKLGEREIVSRQDSEASDASLEIAIERRKGERRKTKIIDSKLPYVSHLMCTRNGKHVVAVTAEDKSVKVLELRNSGRLVLLSARTLPKRLCAIQLTEDETTILAADKFGDVYAFPLFPSKSRTPKQAPEQSERKFEPSATELTVHTKGNLEALRQQREQKKFQPKKEGPDFEHQIILGHVSLLTDLTIAKGHVSGIKRPYIITSDRDEHIRVSRGIPQAHIIENYCLGHTEFISKLCIVPWQPQLLIAGNGEPSLRIYDWQNGRQARTINLLDTFDEQLRSTLAKEGRQHEKTAVSGIWPLWCNEHTSEEAKFIAVGLEGICQLLIWQMNDEGELFDITKVSLPANPLDVVQVGGEQRVIVSLDTLHVANSMKTYRNSTELTGNPLAIIGGTTSTPETGADMGIRWHLRSLPNEHDLINGLFELPEANVKSNTGDKVRERPYSSIGEFLYGLENLRKKKDMVAEEEMDLGAIPVAETVVQIE